MVMRKLGSVMIVVLMGCATGQPSITIADLEGAWWSDTTAATADFALHDGRIWLDHDGQYHTVQLDTGSVLVYDLGPDMGSIKRTLVRLVADTLVMADAGGRETVYVRHE